MGALQRERESVRAALGGHLPPRPDFPYFESETSQYALDNVLATRMLDYGGQVSLLATPAPDFIFLPLQSAVYANPWNCESALLARGIQQTTDYIRSVVASVGKTSYPRIVIPVTTLRSNLEHVLFTPELMEELKDSVVVLSIENAPKVHREGLKYLIDMPYPTGFHLSASATGSKTSIGDFFLDKPRLNLIHYAASASHPWGLPASDPFNGFALRAALHAELDAFTTNRPADATSHVLFDNIVEAADGHQNLTLFHEHMQEAVFCPMPAGDSPSRRGFYEAIQLGCIPVVFRERSYGRLFPSSPDVNDLSRYTVFIDENEMIRGDGPSLIARLEQIPASEVRRLQLNLRDVAQKLQYSLPDHAEEFFPYMPITLAEQAEGVPARIASGRKHNLAVSRERQQKEGVNGDAFTALLRELSTIKQGKWVAGVAKDMRKAAVAFRG